MGFPGLGSYVGFGEETTWNTRVPPTRFFPLMATGDGPGLEREHIKSEAIDDAAYFDDALYQGSRRVSNSLELEFSHVGWTMILAHVFGHKPTGGAGPFVYNFTPPSIPAIVGDGLTIDVVRSASSPTAFSYTGCKINRFQLVCEHNQIAKATLDFIGANVDNTIAKTAPSYSYKPHVRLPTGQSANMVSVNGVVVGCRSFTFTWENNYEIAHMGEDFVGTEPYRSAKPVATWEPVIEFESMAIYNDFLAFTRRSMALVVEHGVSTSVSIAANKILLVSNPEPFVNSMGLITYTPTYQLFADGANREFTFVYANTIDNTIS